MCYLMKHFWKFLAKQTIEPQEEVPRHSVYSPYCHLSISKSPHANIKNSRQFTLWTMFAVKKDSFKHELRINELEFSRWQRIGSGDSLIYSDVGQSVQEKSKLSRAIWSDSRLGESGWRCEDTRSRLICTAFKEPGFETQGAGNTGNIWLVKLWVYWQLNCWSISNAMSCLGAFSEISEPRLSFV